jgi:hypothetical protein
MMEIIEATTRSDSSSTPDATARTKLPEDGRVMPIDPYSDEETGDSTSSGEEQPTADTGADEEASGDSSSSDAEDMPDTLEPSWPTHGSSNKKYYYAAAGVGLLGFIWWYRRREKKKAQQSVQGLNFGQMMVRRRR